MPFKLYVVWGKCIDKDTTISEYEFETEAERLAFIDGADESNGWMDFYTAFDRPEAEQYLNEKLGEEGDE